MSIKAIVFLLFVIFTGTCARSQQSENRKEQISALFQMLEEFHHSPPEDSIVFSNHIYTCFLKNLDPYGLLFTEQDIENVRMYRDSIIAENPAAIETFVNQTEKMYRARIDFADSLVDFIFRVSFDFSKEDSFTVSESDSLIVVPNDSLLVSRWKKWFKLGMLKNIVLSGADSTMLNDEIPDSLVTPGSVVSEKTRLKGKRLIDRLRNYKGGTCESVWNTFLNCVTECCDPHSAFFSITDKDEFESSLSKSNLAFGFDLGNNLNEEVIISQILPGSPAWFSHELEKGDVVVGLEIPGLETSDLAYMDLEEMNDILRNLDGDRIKLIVKKSGNEVDTVSLRKEKLDTRENQSISFVLEGDEPVGYIWFSQFYTEFDGVGVEGCSTDVLRELVKLKEEGTKAIILDLRNNPGGSEFEAMEIAGFFVGRKPLVIRTDKNRNQRILENNKRDKWYDGPLVVLVNGASASASEMLAATLQDYNRAVIAGSNTHRKASEQLILPIGKKFDTWFGNQSQYGNDFGFTKLTMAKIFRITGKSYQKTGVIPDIKIPDLYELFGKRESDLPYALENDSIVIEAVFDKFAKLPLKELDSLSRARIVENPKFTRMESVRDTLKKIITDNRTLSINYKQFKKESETRKQLNPLIEEITTNSVPYITRSTSFDIPVLKNDSIASEINEKFMTSVSKDIYVGEAFSVAVDLIKLQNNKSGK